MRFVGIDLAWSPRNRSGGAVLSDEGTLLDATSSLGCDDEIVEYALRAIGPGAPGIIAVDAPLAVPNETGGRACDRQVAAVFGRFQAGPYPANRRTLGKYGGLRTEAIASRLYSLGFRLDPHIAQQDNVRRLIEVFPHPATVSLFHLPHTLKYKARSKRDLGHRWRELQRLREHLASLATSDTLMLLSPEVLSAPIEGTHGRAFKAVEDLFDAIVCAYSAYYAWVHGPRGYAIYGSEDLNRNPDAGHILVPMTPSMWQRIKRPQILFLDRDGTLNRSFGNRPPNHPHEVTLMPGVAEKLHQYAGLGWHIVIVTNQGGVAYGYVTEPEAHAIQRTVLDALPIKVDASFLCPHHPKGTVPAYAIPCPNRKPSPGAILEALTKFEVEPKACLFVGDQDSDQEAARAAGVPFAWAVDFFGPSTVSP